MTPCAAYWINNQDNKQNKSKELNKTKQKNPVLLFHDFVLCMFFFCIKPSTKKNSNQKVLKTIEK